MMNQKILTVLLLCSSFFLNQAHSADPIQPFRAPAYPLIVIDPYTSAWSFSNNLYDDDVRHWTGTRHSLIGAIRVDGQVYRFMGTEHSFPTPLAFTAEAKNWKARYSFDTPPDGWEKPDFDDSSWKAGTGAFGIKSQQNVSTTWHSRNVWIRRDIILDDDQAGHEVLLDYSHSGSFELYLNGIKVAETSDTHEEHVQLALPDSVTKSLKKGLNTFAAHCKNKNKDGYVDFGLFNKAITENHFKQTALQQSVTVLPTQTKYLFQCGPIRLNLTFTSPLIPENLALLSRPVNYISYNISSADRKTHNVQIYFEATPEWAVNRIGQTVKTERLNGNGLTFLKTGTTSQNILGNKGDNVRIDWGYFYLAGNTTPKSEFIISDYNTAKKTFADKGTLSELSIRQSETSNPAVNMTSMVYINQLGKIGLKPVSGKIMLGYDDINSIRYFGQNLFPWWKNDHTKTIYDAFDQANRDYSTTLLQCTRFNQQLLQDAQKAGGDKYAQLCALAFRQAIGAHKIVKGPHGELLFFSKENFSNGSIGTVDVTYPSAPLFLYYNSSLLKGMMDFIFEYSESGKWTKPFPAHDVGTYPIAEGQTYGTDMPVEEAGNMLLLTTAIASVDKNASYAEKHWNVLSVWAETLLKKGADPENQLCTDDFAGHMAHNANLSVKAILGLAGYAKLAAMLGKKDLASQYSTAASDIAIKWISLANEGDHYRLAFDRKNTWSQKYNLIWDQLLGLSVFPKEVTQKEIAFYLNHQNHYGLPLDNRATYTKSDWIMWTAAMANDLESFNFFIDPIYKAYNESSSRVPLSDWYQTTDASQSGFQARSVVGGFFMKMLCEKLKTNK